MDQIGAMLGRQQIWRTWNYPFLFCHKQINVKKEWCYGDNGNEFYHEATKCQCQLWWLMLVLLYSRQVMVGYIHEEDPANWSVWFIVFCSTQIYVLYIRHLMLNVFMQKCIMLSRLKLNKQRAAIIYVVASSPRKAAFMFPSAENVWGCNKEILWINFYSWRLIHNLWTHNKDLVKICSEKIIGSFYFVLKGNVK